MKANRRVKTNQINGSVLKQKKHPSTKNKSRIKTTRSSQTRTMISKPARTTPFSPPTPLAPSQHTSNTNGIQFSPFRSLPHRQQRLSFSTFDLNVEYDPAAVTTGPDPGAVRSVFRQLLRNTNPRIQSMKPRRSIRLSHGYKAIVNEYRTKMSCGIVDAWKYHATASQLVQALKANTYNANTLYQSGWKPARPQKQQVEGVARQLGLGLTQNPTSQDDLDSILNPTQANLEEMLLFSNKNKIRIDPKTDTHQQILGDDSIFMDIFGGSEPQADIRKVLDLAKVNTSGIDEDLQRALFEDLGFGVTNDDEGDGDVNSNQLNECDTIAYYDEEDMLGFPIKVNANKQRLHGLNGWEVPVQKLTTTFHQIPPSTSGTNDAVWDSALAYADGSMNFTRSLATRITNSTQHNENVYSLGLIGCLFNDVDNIDHPRTTNGFYAGITNFATPTTTPHRM